MASSKLNQGDCFVLVIDRELVPLVQGKSCSSFGLGEDSLSFGVSPFVHNGSQSRFAVPGGWSRRSCGAPIFVQSCCRRLSSFLRCRMVPGDLSC